MTSVSCNCTVCAQEFDVCELKSIALSTINVTNFRICQACLDNSNPAEDYREVRDIINSYSTKLAQKMFVEASSILKLHKK